MIRTFAKLRAGVRALLPQPFTDFWRRHKRAALRARNRGRSAGEIFGDIYRDNHWGGGAGTFSSGSGSTPEHARRYADAVRAFIRERGVRRVVDLGCGDFKVGAEIVDALDEYIGVDVVDELVQHNQRVFGSERVRFVCLDAAEQPLPGGDLCLIRQVLQHLSNEQIENVLRNTDRFRYVLVTEHYPAPGAEKERNLDKPCGEDIRVYDGSAVYLDAPPFSRAVVGPILDVDAGHWLVSPGERIRTFLIDNGAIANVNRG